MKLDVTEVVEETARELAPLFRRHRLASDVPRAAAARPWLARACCAGCSATCSRTRPSTRRRTGTIDIYGWREGGRVILAITDDGPGIPAEWRERIFEPFVRLDDSPRGAGIGLFAARHLARSMGGDLRAEDRAPRGIQFVLELPAAA